MELAAKGFGGTFWGDENVLYFDCGGDHMDECSCQNVSNCTFKIE